MTFTDRDMRTQVVDTLPGLESDYDVNAIVDELQLKYGTVLIDTIPSGDYWAVVSRHDRTFVI